MCYHRGGLIHHYDVLQTDDIAALCAPPFDPDVILAYAARVLEFLQHHCADDRSQYWLLGDGSAEGGLHLYDVTKGIIAASVGDESPGAGTTGEGAEGAEGAEGNDSDDSDDGGRALPAPRSVRLPWVTPAGALTSQPTTTTTTPSRPRGLDTSTSGDRLRRRLRSIRSVRSRARKEDVPNPGVAGAAGRYALLERVASVLSPSAHPAMFSAYKEELAAACLAGVSDDPSQSGVGQLGDESSGGGRRGRGRRPGVGRGNRRQTSRLSPRG